MVTPTVASLCLRLGHDLTPVEGFTPPTVEVSAVHISELLDPTAYLSGGELLLTTGLSIPKNMIGCEKYVRRLIQVGISALGFGIGPVHHTIPETLVSACRHLDLCLLAVPAPTPFLTITKAYWSALSQHTEQHLSNALAAQRELVNAASTDDPVPALLRILARALDGFTTLLDTTGEVQQVHPLGRRGDAEAIRSEIDRFKGAGVHSAATFPSRGHVIVVYPMAVRDRLVGYLAAATREVLAPTERRLVLTTCALLSLHFANQQRQESVLHAHRRSVALLVDMGLVDAARRLGVELSVPAPAGRAHVLVVYSAERDEVVRAVNEWCAEALTVLESDPKEAWILLPEGLPATERLASQIRVIDGEARAVLSPALEMEQVASARRRLTHELTTTPAQPGRLKLDPSGTSTTADLAHGLDALSAYQRADLVGALSVYLRHRGQWEPAARALQVHRNTLRHRIGRCQEILQVDLDDPDVSADLWLLLRERGLT